MEEVTGAWEVWVVEVTPTQAGVVKPGGLEVVMIEPAEVMLGQAGVVMIERGEATHWLMMVADLRKCR